MGNTNLSVNVIVKSDPKNNITINKNWGLGPRRVHHEVTKLLDSQGKSERNMIQLVLSVSRGQIVSKTLL